MSWLWRPYVIGPIGAVVVLGLPLFALSAVSADLDLSIPNCEENADAERHLLRQALSQALPAERQVRYRDRCPALDVARASWSVGATPADDAVQLVAAGWTKLASQSSARPGSERDHTPLVHADHDAVIWLTAAKPAPAKATQRWGEPRARTGRGQTVGGARS